MKENQSYRLCLQYEYIGSGQQGKKVLEKKLEELNARLPAGYSAEIDEYTWGWDNKDLSRYWLLALVALIIFFISSILFNSLARPLAIIAVIPISFAGIFMTFPLFDLKFDQGGFASFILLSGITVNAAIYLISEFSGRRKVTLDAGRGTVTVYMRAFRVKIMPIIMTVLSTVLGFIPFLVGTDKESFGFLSPLKHYWRSALFARGSHLLSSPFPAPRKAGSRREHQKHARRFRLRKWRISRR